MPSISEFSSTMSKGFARPNLFKVRIGRGKADAIRIFQHSCFQAQIPGNNILTSDKDIGFRSIAYQKAFSDIILGFYVSGSKRELKFWQDWIYEIVDKKTNVLHYYNEYANGHIGIEHIGRDGHDRTQWILHEAYPKQVDPIQLDYGTNDAVMTCNVTITYRYFEVDWNPKYTIDRDSSIGPQEVLGTQSSNTDMNKQNDMLETLDPTQNWKFGNAGTRNGFLAAHPGFLGWKSKQRQMDALRHYGINNLHGDSKSGGAGSMVDEFDR